MHPDVKDRDFSSFGYAKEQYTFTATSGSVRYAAALAKKVPQGNYSVQHSAAHKLGQPKPAMCVCVCVRQAGYHM